MDFIETILTGVIAGGTTGVVYSIATGKTSKRWPGAVDENLVYFGSIVGGVVALVFWFRYQ